MSILYQIRDAIWDTLDRSSVSPGWKAFIIIISPILVVLGVILAVMEKIFRRFNE